MEKGTEALEIEYGLYQADIWAEDQAELDRLAKGWKNRIVRCRECGDLVLWRDASLIAVEHVMDEGWYCGWCEDGLK